MPHPNHHRSSVRASGPVSRPRCAPRGARRDARSRALGGRCIRAVLLAIAGLVGVAAGVPTGGNSTSANAPEPSGSSESAAEYRLKAAFLSNFVKYTQWPTTALPKGAPLDVVLVGPEPQLARVEELLAGREVRGHRLRVRRSSTIVFEGSAHMVFAAGLGGSQEADLRTHVGKRPMLLVANREQAARDGCAIAFYPHRGKVRFAVNKKALSATGLKVSSELLKLAKIVGVAE